MCHTQNGKVPMLQEIDFMIELNGHPHLLALLGCSRISRDPIIITELCTNGDLLSFLRKTKDPLYENKGYELSSPELLPLAWQISDALLYLISKQLIHRDVAARNVLLTAEKMAKLSDFGLCRRVNEEAYKSNGGLVPVKWMAPESIKTAKFTEKTDIWSFGVFLFELYSFGQPPFANIDPKELYEHLKNGDRLEIPTKETPNEIKELATSCWAFEEEKRPNFEQVSLTLYKLLESDKSEYYLDFLKNYSQEVVEIELEQPD